MKSNGRGGGDITCEVFRREKIEIIRKWKKIKKCYHYADAETVLMIKVKARPGFVGKFHCAGSLKVLSTCQINMRMT